MDHRQSVEAVQGGSDFSTLGSIVGPVIDVLLDPAKLADAAKAYVGTLFC